MESRKIPIFDSEIFHNDALLGNDFTRYFEYRSYLSIVPVENTPTGLSLRQVKTVEQQLLYNFRLISKKFRKRQFLHEKWQQKGQDHINNFTLATSLPKNLDW